MQSIAGIRGLANLLAPPRCAACGRACAGDRLICDRCAAALAEAKGGRDRLGDPGRAGEVTLPVTVVWAAPYAGVARDLVTALKFHGRLGVAALIAEALATALATEPPLTGAPWALVAVPPSRARRRSRGFDPAELVAAALAGELDLPVGRCLARAGGPRQVGRRRSERLASPPRVWATRAVPHRALLVDDVLTTGATLAACSAALRSSGAAEVRAVVFARALGPGRPGRPGRVA